MTTVRAAIGAALMGVLTGLAAPAAAADFDRFTGRYAYTGDDAQKQARLDAIEATVQQMPKLFRAFARGRIDKSTTPAERYDLEVADGQIRIGRDGGQGRQTVLGGDGVVVEGDEGADLTVTRVVEGDCIRHRAEQHNGYGTDLFCLSQDDKTLTVTVTIGSDQLPAPITYELTYRREP